jgi:hypothetical protein
LGIDPRLFANSQTVLTILRIEIDVGRVCFGITTGFGGGLKALHPPHVELILPIPVREGHSEGLIYLRTFFYIYEAAGLQGILVGGEENDSVSGVASAAAGEERCRKEHAQEKYPEGSRESP